MKFDVILIEKPGTKGLKRSEVMDMFDSLNEDNAYPIEIPNSNGESSAMGFITASGAEKIDYDYDDGFNQFVGDILADMELESPDGTYEFEGLRIFITR